MTDLPKDLLDLLARLAPLDAGAVADARAHQDRLTKPRGSLGVLEDLSVQLAGLAGRSPAPLPEPAAVAVFAADHGVHAQGVSPWPQEVTGQMVANFLAGGAVVNVLASQVGARVVVVDVGVAGDVPAHADLVSRKVAPGTADLSTGPAMTREQVLAALRAGAEVAQSLVDDGARCLLTGDMGIANTTASAALVAALLEVDPAEVTGRGTGVDDATLALKTDVVRRALELHALDADDPLAVLAAVGGLEHAALVGFLLAASALRVPVVLDGVIACSAALVASRLHEHALVAAVAGHRSVEPGASAALAAMGLRPVLDLDLRLGEGSGAVLALPVLQSAARVLRDVATFDSAGVADK